jgi:hypothetical protein
MSLGALRNFINNQLIEACAEQADRDPKLRDNLSRQTLRKYFEKNGVTNWTQREIWAALYEYQWKPTVTKMTAVLAELRTTTFCSDATYPSLGRVKAHQDWLTYSQCATTHDTLLSVLDEELVKNTAAKLRAKHDDEDGDDSDDDDQCEEEKDAEHDKKEVDEHAVVDVFTKRARLASISCSMYVISDENEAVHLACPINGVDLSLFRDSPDWQSQYVCLCG